MAYISGADSSSNRKGCGVVQPRIIKYPLSLHFQVRHKSIPMGNGAPTGVGGKVHSSESECGGQERCPRFPIRSERLPIQKQRRIEFSRTPALQNCSYGCFVHLEHVRKCCTFRREIADGADV